VALKAYIDTPRWKGVPFYLRTGKYLPNKATEISLHFKKPVCPDDMCLFNPNLVYRNVLTLKIQPNEGIVLRLMVKKPGFGMDLSVTQMEFNYQHAFGKSNHEAYERLFLDAIRGDQTLFASTEEIKASWEFMMSILEVWTKGVPPLGSYKKNSWGPVQAMELIQKDGRHWFLSEK
jgi:glucose-6-phosphate 1-dehydrogenase